MSFSWCVAILSYSYHIESDALWMRYDAHQLGLDDVIPEIDDWERRGLNNINTICKNQTSRRMYGEEKSKESCKKSNKEIKEEKDC